MSRTFGWLTKRRPIASLSGSVATGTPLPKVVAFQRLSCLVEREKGFEPVHLGKRVGVRAGAGKSRAIVALAARQVAPATPLRSRPIGVIDPSRACSGARTGGGRSPLAYDFFTDRSATGPTLGSLGRASAVTLVPGYMVI